MRQMLENARALRIIRKCQRGERGKPNSRDRPWVYGFLFEEKRWNWEKAGGNEVVEEIMKKLIRNQARLSGLGTNGKELKLQKRIGGLNFELTP